MSWGSCDGGLQAVQVHPVCLNLAVWALFAAVVCHGRQHMVGEL